MQNFKGKKITVMGLGSYAKGSGIAAALFFAKAGARVLVTDMKPASFFITPFIYIHGVSQII